MLAEPSGRRPSSPSLVLMNSRHSQEGQVRPLGSLMRSELPFMTVILVLIKVQNQLRADVQPENTTLPRWLIQHLAGGWLFTTHSMPHSCRKPQSKTQELSVLHLSTGRERRDVRRDELQPPDSCSTRLCITVYLTYMETPCRLGIWSGGFHFSHSLLPRIDDVGGEKHNNDSSALK